MRKVFSLFVLGLLLAGNVAADQSEIQRLHSVTALDEANVCHDLEQFDIALALVDEVLSHDLNAYERSWALLDKGRILTRMGRAEESLAIYAELLPIAASVDPSQVLLSSIFYEQSKALSKVGDHEASIRVVSLGIEIAKQAEFISFSREFRVEQMSIRLGRYLFLAGDAEEGHVSLENTIGKLKQLLDKEDNIFLVKSIHCEISVAYRELVIIWVALGNTERAIECCEQAIHHGELCIGNNMPDHPWLQQLQERLRGLQQA